GTFREARVTCSATTWRAKFPGGYLAAAGGEGQKQKKDPPPRTRLFPPTGGGPRVGPAARPPGTAGAGRCWSRSGGRGGGGRTRHTGRTDIPLTPAGEAAAARLAPAYRARRVVAAFSSPMQRAVRTAELAGLTAVPRGLKIDPDLAEWDYGGYEGKTTKE